MTVPASYEKLINDVESELRDVQVDTSLDHPRNPLQVAGKVIARSVEWSSDTRVTELEAENEQLKRALAQHTFDGESLNLREAVRTELIAVGVEAYEQLQEQKRLVQAQNDIIDGLHTQRRAAEQQRDQAMAALAALMKYEKAPSLEVTDHFVMRHAGKLAIIPQTETLSTRFEWADGKEGHW
ncbi:hypothetical protein SEA_SICARIUS2_47 [Arthrobacter phage Sicarius2]|uniref:Uncharacterized protein n=1 Tax=Arthrobacter phage Sicarius2 TaxID=2836090 RepID=A0A8F3INX1_9CAUD|nr:hypothetical protein SEA_SICARIUS2_47 [Arthrobacter phage Sicarius2]